MSNRDIVDRAVRRAESRDRKHRKRMTVAGKSVFLLRQLLRRGK